MRAEANPRWPTIFSRTENITALDISEAAIDVCKKRIGSASEQIRRLVADVTVIQLES